MMKRKTSDDMPLSTLKDHNSYNSLCQQAWERCEFCEEIFSTRLENIKHNASHIIIPLLKLTLHQCEECLFHFTSLNDLRTHATTKNHNTSQLTSHKAGYEDLLQSIVDKQLVVKCHDTFKISSPKVHSPIKSEQETLIEIPKEIYSLKSVRETPIEIPKETYSLKSEQETPIVIPKETYSLESVRETAIVIPKETYIKSEQAIAIEISSDSDSSTVDIKNNYKIEDELSSPVESARSRIMFEDDDDDLFEPEEILPDKPNTYILGSIKLNGSTELNEVISTNVNGASVHYNELIVPDICDCRYCGRCFANRLELIKHETLHMQVNRTNRKIVLCYVCEKYLSGNHWTLRRHLQDNHPTSERKLAIYKCDYCHLNYHNYQKHVSLHHIVTCKVCNRRMDREKLKLHDCFHYEPEINESIIKMCEMCLTFTKNRHNVHYEVIGEHSEVGIRQQCDKCLAKYFEVKLVKRKVKAREGDGEVKKRKPMSNQERLKKMQNRLKMVKRLNKC